MHDFANTLFRMEGGAIPGIAASIAVGEPAYPVGAVLLAFPPAFAVATPTVFAQGDDAALLDIIADPASAEAAPGLDHSDVPGGMQPFRYLLSGRLNVSR